MKKLFLCFKDEGIVYFDEKGYHFLFKKQSTIAKRGLRCFEKERFLICERIDKECDWLARFDWWSSSVDIEKIEKQSGKVIWRDTYMYEFGFSRQFNNILLRENNAGYKKYFDNDLFLTIKNVKDEK